VIQCRQFGNGGGFGSARTTYSERRKETTMQHGSTGGFKVQRLKVAALLALAVMMTALLAAPASADQPVKWVWDPEPITEPVLDLCPFDVQLTAIIHDQGTDYFDKNGVWYRTLQHAEEQDTFVGPYGATLAGLPFRFSIHGAFDANGDYVRFLATGITEKVPLPDGGLFIGAGQIDWLPHLSDSGFILTPDHGATVNLDRFCAALGAGEP
jgi:hypothetical protein